MWIPKDSKSNRCFEASTRQSGEGGIRTLAPLLATCTLSRGVPSTSLGTSPSTPSDCSTYFKRRGWDSNPRALTDKRFSRPPHYDRFDTSPYGLFSWFSLLLFRRSAKASISKWKHRVNDFFKYLPSFFFKYSYSIFDFHSQTAETPQPDPLQRACGDSYLTDTFWSIITTWHIS